MSKRTFKKTKKEENIKLVLLESLQLKAKLPAVKKYDMFLEPPPLYSLSEPPSGLNGGSFQILVLIRLTLTAVDDLGPVN